VSASGFNRFGSVPSASGSQKGGFRFAQNLRTCPVRVRRKNRDDYLFVPAQNLAIGSIPFHPVATALVLAPAGLCRRSRTHCAMALLM